MIGSQGFPGDKGEQGDQGDDGASIKGVVGSPGEMGQPGPKGYKGQRGITFECNQVPPEEMGVRGTIVLPHAWCHAFLHYLVTFVHSVFRFSWIPWSKGRTRAYRARWCSWYTRN